MLRRLFPSQLEDEHIYLVVREHWIRLLFKIIIWFLFALALILFQRFGKEYIPGLFEGVPGIIISLFTQIYTLFLILSLLIIWELYYLNIQIITNLRIVDIDQVGLFAHTVSELHIENIEDVTSKTTGLMGTIFNYGQVFVQTAGTVEHFVFENIPNPAAVERLVLDLYEHIPKNQNK